MGSRSAIEKEIIFFDGICNLCNGVVNFILDRDKKAYFQFSSLQSSCARELLPRSILNLESIVLLTPSGDVYDKSDAVLRIAQGLGGKWKLLCVFKILPKGFRDWLYQSISRNRYRWFGKRTTCRIPSPELQERFLEAF